MRTVVPSFSTTTPSADRQDKVAAQSAAVEKFSTVEKPSAREAINAARCEIDLSPGTEQVPFKRRADAILMASS
jgi:hypothetical protein